MVDWGVPDWTDATGYPTDASAREWWWEFTRRRPDYRLAWEGAAPTNEWGYRYAADPVAFRLQFRLTAIYDPTCQFNDWDLAHYISPVTTGRTPRRRIAEQVDVLDELTKEWLSSVAASEKLEEDAGLYDVRFDLTKPIAPQLAKARRLLETAQNTFHPDVKDRRPRTGSWQTFLRVLDARDVNATYDAISAVVWPGQNKTPQSARDSYQAACQLRDNFPL